VLVLGLGCENNQMDQLLAARRRRRGPRRALRFFNTQDVVDEVEAGVEMVGELVARMASDRREPCPAPTSCSATSAAAPTASAGSPPTRCSAASPTA
jgi:altronate dehydratase